MNYLTYIVGALALTLLLCVVGIIMLAMHHQPVPDVLQNIAVGSLGALAGALVPARLARSQP